MKVGIITFHWATNYGAVLQAYALRSFLSKLGHDVKIIDYLPRAYGKNFIKCFITKRPWLIKHKLIEYYKERKFINFRKMYFNLTVRYNSLQELKTNPPEFDVYICGSDQIWNPSFTTCGEGQVTTSYFLDFGNEKAIRIAYAASFGCTEYTEEIKNLVSPILRQFKAISVREKTGAEILRSMGFENVSLLPDPTLLLSDKDYDEIIDCTVINDKNFSFFYVIHDHQFTIKKIENYFRNKLNQRIVSTKKLRSSMIDVKEWLSHIRAAKFIVTNSFHGIIFSIIFKKQFIAVPVEGPLSSMNDRIFTLLEQLGLQDRILNNFDQDRIAELLMAPIEWHSIEENIQTLRKDAELFLLNSIRPDSIDEYPLKQNDLVEAGV